MAADRGSGGPRPRGHMVVSGGKDQLANFASSDPIWGKVTPYRGL